MNRREEDGWRIDIFGKFLWVLRGVVGTEERDGILSQSENWGWENGDRE